MTNLRDLQTPLSKQEVVKLMASLQGENQELVKRLLFQCEMLFVSIISLNISIESLSKYPMLNEELADQIHYISERINLLLNKNKLFCGIYKTTSKASGEQKFNNQLANCINKLKDK